METTALGLAVLAAVYSRGCIAACPFAGVGTIPPGNDDVRGRRLLGTYPGKIEDPLADESGRLSSSIPIPGSEQPTPTTHLQDLWQISQNNDDAELCYWAFHTLPGPQMTQQNPSVTDDDVNQWNKDNYGDPADNFGDVQAKDMRDRIVQDGSIVWSGCSMGRILRQKLCDKGVDVSGEEGARAQDCSLDAVKNQALMFPTGTYIFKIQNSRKDILSQTLTNYRTIVHKDAYQSELGQRGWGDEGQIISKTVDCSQIPTKYMYSNSGTCDQLGESKLLADEAFDVWSGLCSITKGDACPTTVTTTATTVSTTATTGTATSTTVSATSTTATTETTATFITTLTASVVLRLTFSELDYEELTRNLSMHEDFKAAVKKVFSDKFNVPEGQLSVSTSAGSVVAIVEVSNMGLARAEALKESVENYKDELSSGAADAEDDFVKALKEVDGIVAALPDGDLNSLSVPSVSVETSPSPAPPPSRPVGVVLGDNHTTSGVEDDLGENHTTDGQEDDKNKISVIRIIIGASVLVCCLLCACVACKRRWSYKVSTMSQEHKGLVNDTATQYGRSGSDAVSTCATKTKCKHGEECASCHHVDHLGEGVKGRTGGMAADAASGPRHGRGSGGGGGNLSTKLSL